MGNTQTLKKNKDINLLRLLDSIATKYIATSSFQDLTKLNNHEYCNKLILLTSDILNTRFTTQQIEFINQRIKEGKEINELESKDVMLLNKDNIDKLDIKQKSKKRRMCIGIAKYYIKIAHIYNAILTTINPQYKYKDETGKIRNISKFEKFNLNQKNLSKTNYNLCSRRINSVLVNQLKDTETVELKPKICDLNKGTLNTSLGSFVNEKDYTKTLLEEPGIPELKYLYYDIYDYNNGKFVSMSEGSKRAFNKDLQTFYKAFTGNNEMPENIKDFSDIKLKDYHNKTSCKENPVLRKVINTNIKSRLIKNYANHINKIKSQTSNIRNKLINILNYIFVYTINPETNNKDIIINPKLTNSKLDEITKITREIIVSLYVSCENDFTKSLKLFEAIVEDQIKRNNLRRIDNIQKIKLEKSVE